MAKVELHNITKEFKNTVALDNINLTINDNEFFVLFGPAGAGKTTLLKIIAGAEFPEVGTVKIGGKIMNQTESRERNVSMVFENYALYPNLSVYNNIASPLRSRLYRQNKNDIENAVVNITKKLKIDNLLDRKPTQLSNGQRQRVALGRSLVRKPDVFLLDEPLAHLDARLRNLMRAELKEMQSSINSTTIYVTHDYMEAMSLADRIAVLNEGKIIQIGSAIEMYYLPHNEFIGRLFGEPELNIIEGEYTSEKNQLCFHVFNQEVKLYPEKDVVETLLARKDSRIHIGFRSHDVQFAFTKPAENWMQGSVYAIEPIGNKVIITVLVGTEKFALSCPNDTHADIDQTIYFKLNMKNAIYFDPNTLEFITRSEQSLYMR